MRASRHCDIHTRSSTNHSVCPQPGSIGRSFLHRAKTDHRFATARQVGGVRPRDRGGKACASAFRVALPLGRPPALKVSVAAHRFDGFSCFAISAQKREQKSCSCAELQLLPTERDFTHTINSLSGFWQSEQRCVVMGSPPEEKFWFSSHTLLRVSPRRLIPERRVIEIWSARCLCPRPHPSRSVPRVPVATHRDPPSLWFRRGEDDTGQVIDRNGKGDEVGTHEIFAGGR